MLSKYPNCPRAKGNSREGKAREEMTAKSFLFNAARKVRLRPQEGGGGGMSRKYNDESTCHGFGRAAGGEMLVGLVRGGTATVQHSASMHGHTNTNWKSVKLHEILNSLRLRSRIWNPLSMSFGRTSPGDLNFTAPTTCNRKTMWYLCTRR